MMTANEGAIVTPRRIAIVDDELGPASFSDLPEDVQRTLSDRNSPDLETIWAIAHVNHEVPALDSLSLAEVQQQVESERFVNRVLLRAEFLPQFPPAFREHLQPLLEKLEKAAALKQSVDAAFPAPDFVVEVFSTRPNPPQQLLTYDFLIMDLVMDDSDPVVTVSSYLKELSQAAGDVQQIPPILLISQRTDLDKHRLTFRTSGEISAAGLCIVSKQTIASKEYGADGLKLLWDQMCVQASAAHRMRVLCRAWSRTLDAAKGLTAETLWNLDAAALQQIYQTARTDNDPFEEHLHEIVSREHLWHLEREAILRAAITELGNIYAKHYGKDGDAKKPAYRYATHATTDMRALRQVEHHFSWSGVDTSIDLVTQTAEALGKELNRALPLGTVLAPYNYATLAEREVLVHVTQECDLNKSDIVQRDSSLFFARAVVVKPGTSPDGVKRIVKGFVFNGEDRDLLVDPAQLIALPIKHCIRWKKRWRIAGRVRRDIARQLLQASTNNATRVAAFKTTGSHQTRARVCIRLGQQRRTPPRDFWYGVEGEGQPPENAQPIEVSTFSVDEKVQFHFLDGESFNLTVWMKQRLAALGKDDLLPTADMRTVWDQLRLGVELKDNVSLCGLQYTARYAKAELMDNRFSTITVGPDTIRIIIAIDLPPP